VRYFNQTHAIPSHKAYLEQRTKNFWTSGANDGISCDVQGVYAWCALGELVPPGMLSAFIKPSNSSSERCLLLNAASTDNSTSLTHANCTQKMPYICEPPCKAPKCPSECAKNVNQLLCQFLPSKNRFICRPLYSTRKENWKVRLGFCNNNHIN
jgi:hypothetical protein